MGEDDLAQLSGRFVKDEILDIRESVVACWRFKSATYKMILAQERMGWIGL